MWTEMHGLAAYSSIPTKPRVYRLCSKVTSGLILS